MLVNDGEIMGDTTDDIVASSVERMVVVRDIECTRPRFGL